MPNMYLIWSFENDAWWMPDESGYTRNIKQAGRYNQTDAGRIVTNEVFNDEVAVLEQIALRQGPPMYHPYRGEPNRGQTS